MNVYLKDVLSQPVSIRNVLDRYLSKENLEKMDALANLKFDKVVFTGMGSSHFCNYGANIYLNNNGYTSIIMSASQLLNYEMGLVNERTLLVLVSQSGESAEIVSLIKEISTRITVVGITNNPQSTLGKRADYVFNMDVEKEVAVSTRTYLASVLLTGLMAKSITGTRDQVFINSVLKTGDLLEKELSNYRDTYALLKDFLKDAAYLCIMGRGYSLSSACAGALFIREAAKYPCIDFDSGEFRHGSFEMVEKGFHGIVFAPRGKTYEYSYKLACNIAAKDGKVILVTNKKPDIEQRNILTLQQEIVDEMLLPILEIVPVQLTAIALADIKGIEAGKFRWSAKITNTQ